MDDTDGTRQGRDGVAALLFVALFAAQAGLVALSPVLAGVGTDLGVSSAAAGQLRTVSGLAAGLTALAVPRLSRQRSLRAVLLAGLALLAAGSLASAGAPTFAALAGAQVVVGAGIAATVAAATAAAAAWSTEERRAHVLSTALNGQPAAWVVGMPLAGVVGGLTWRYGLALPVAASLVAAVLAARRPEDGARGCGSVPLRDAAADPRIRRWAIAELLANSGWAGTLVYTGALFADSYATSPARTGVCLAAGAAAYIAGNRSARRLVRIAGPRHLVTLALVLAPTVSLLGAFRPDAAASTALFALAASLAGARTLISSAYGLAFAPERRLLVTSLRTATMQFGYFAGSLAAGTALALAGYTAFGATLAALFVASALVLAGPVRLRRPLVMPSASPES